MAGSNLKETIDSAAIDKKYSDADEKDSDAIHRRFDPWANRIEQLENAGRIKRGTAAEYRRRLEKFIETRRKHREKLRQKEQLRVARDNRKQRIGLITGRENAAAERGDFEGAVGHAKARGQEYLNAANRAASDGRIAEARKLSALYDQTGADVQKWRQKAKEAAQAEKKELEGHREELTRIKEKLQGVKEAAAALEIITPEHVTQARELAKSLAESARAIQAMGGAAVAVPNADGLVPGNGEAAPVVEPVLAPRPNRPIPEGVQPPPRPAPPEGPVHHNPFFEAAEERRRMVAERVAARKEAKEEAMREAAEERRLRAESIKEKVEARERRALELEGLRSDRLEAIRGREPGPRVDAPAAPRVAAPVPNPGKPGVIPQGGKGAVGGAVTTNTMNDNSTTVSVGRVVVNKDMKIGDLGKSKAAAIRMGRG
ncbi:hypothetical protein LzC2_00730 [Planctomycetes bacterium LzC2]|uniref:Uncharacterized protein n=1 Tax=Alienimonas chondri TaxID=2681879 RepID=A0ABX1V7I7_9PLAN|nr:hypothetical protein [Alienimonas chondri]